MSRIADIKDKFKLICDENSSVRTFEFDAPSALNLVRDNYYPLVLLKLPEKSKIPDYNKNWELWDLTFYVCESRWQSETRTLEQQHDDLKIIAEDIIDEFIFYPQVYQIPGEVNFEYGYDADNNNVTTVVANFTARVFNCRDNTATGEKVNITDNNNDLVGTVNTRTTLQVIAKDDQDNTINATYGLSSGVLTLSDITLTYEDITFQIYLDGVLSATSIETANEDLTLNITLT